MNIFQPNNFTQKAMPLSTILGRLIDRSYCHTASSEMAECIKKYADIHDRFFGSLDEHQKELFEKIGFTVGETAEIDIREHFNRGFFVGAVLTTEVFLKNYPNDKNFC